MLWGWTDWLIKLKSRTQVEDTYILVIHSPYTYPQKEYFVPIDQTFVEGQSPWQTEMLYPADSQMWHPCLKYQERQIENICETGPFVAKTTSRSIEANMYYRFYLKWGGCTTDLQNIVDPGDLPHFPVPNNWLQTPEIQDPESDPKNEIWSFDTRRQMLTESAAKRIKQDFTSPKIAFTDSKMSTEPSSSTQIQTFNKKKTQKEEEEDPQQQLQLLRDHQHHLRKQLRQLLNQTPSLKYSAL